MAAARKNHAVINTLGSRNVYNVANSADFDFNTCDPATGDEFVMDGSGEHLLLCRNTDQSNTHTVTIESVEDPFGRVANTTYVMATRQFAAFGPFRRPGWRQVDGTVRFSGDDTAIQFAVLRV